MPSSLVRALVSAEEPGGVLTVVMEEMPVTVPVMKEMPSTLAAAVGTVLSVP